MVSRQRPSVRRSSGMKRSSLLQHLRRHGCYLKREGRAHSLWCNPQTGAVEAIKRLSRSPHWVWVAMDPVCKLILAVDVGERTLAMAQRLVHQVTQVLASDVRPAVSDRWISGVPHRAGHALRPVDAARAPPGQRAPAQAAVDAAARAALCAGGQVLPAQAHRLG